jgi:hypothetical protein
MLKSLVFTIVNSPVFVLRNFLPRAGLHLDGRGNDLARAIRPPR